MALVLVGINHNTANIEMREKVAFPPEIVESALADIHGLPVIEKSCSCLPVIGQKSIWISGKTDEAGDSSEAARRAAANRQLLDRQAEVVAWLSKFHDLEIGELEQCSYSFADEDVIRHLMKVSCGLDSMVLGEPQILGQIKSAYAVSKDRDVVGPALVAPLKRRSPSPSRCERIPPSVRIRYRLPMLR